MRSVHYRLHDSVRGSGSVHIKYKLLPYARRVPTGYIIEGRHEAKPSVPRGDIAARHVSACNNAFVTHQLAETHYSTTSLFLQVISTVAAQSFVDVERC